MTEPRPADGSPSAADDTGAGAPRAARPGHPPGPPQRGRRGPRFRKEALERHGIARTLGPAVEPPSAVPFAHLRLRSMLARLADIRQAGLRRRHVPVRIQLQATDCGPTCLAIVLAYHGIDLDLPTLRKETNSGRDGVSIRVLLDTARRYGLTGRGVSTNVAGLRGLPAGSILFWNFGHFVVLERVTRDGVEVVDPALGRRRLSFSQVSDSFTGVALEFQPPLQGAKRPAARWKASNPWRFLRHFFPRTRAWFPLAGASLLLMASNLTIPVATYLVASNVVQGRSIGAAPSILLGLLVLVAVFFLLQATRSLAILAMQTVSDKRVTLGVLGHLLSLPYEFFLNRGSGDLAMRIRTSTQVRQLLTSTTLSSIFDGLLILLYMVLLLLADVPLALVVIGLAVLQVAVLVLAWRRQRYLAADALEAQSRAQTQLTELLDGMTTLKSTGLDAVAAERWSHSLVEEINARVRSKRNLALWTGGSLCIQFGAPLVVLLVGSLRVADGGLSLGKVLGFSALALGWFVPLANLVQVGLQMSDLRATLARMADILDTEPENSGPDLTQVRHVEGGLAVRTASFSYPGSRRAALTDIEFSVSPGEFVVIIGESGCGKSTLAMLLAGLYLPSPGEVQVDGIPTGQLDRGSLRGAISFVNQDTRLFGASIRDNIVWGTGGLTEDDIKAAAKIARIHYPITEMPMGYDTMLGSGGIGLSGGQRQRVALTRALVRKPKLLILDEATSALDPQLEERVFASLTSLDCTLVVIAHRLTNLHLADRIVVLDNGRLVQQGSYMELQEQGGAFAALSFERLRSAGVPGDSQAKVAP